MPILKDGELTPKQKAFVRAYRKCYNVKRASKQAGINYEYGLELISKNKVVRRAIYDHDAEAEQKSELSVETFTRELFYLSTRSVKQLYKKVKGKRGRLLKPHELDDHIAACVDGVKETTFVMPNGVIKRTIEYKLNSKQAALDLVARHKGLIAAIKHEIDGDVKFTIDFEKLYTRPTLIGTLVEKKGQKKYISMDPLEDLIMNPDKEPPVLIDPNAHKYHLSELMDKLNGEGEDEQDS